MKRRRYYLLAMLLVVGSQLVSGQESLNRRDDLRRSTGRNDDSLLEHLRSVVKTAEVADVSYIFTKSKEVAVTKGRSGDIRILVGRVRNELLKTKINGVTFKPVERYNAREAINAIIQTKEVQAKLRTLEVEQPLTALGGVMQEPIPRLPHLPASMKNVTMEDALDRIAQTFSGVIIYGEWRSADGTRLFDVDFVRLTAFEKLSRRSR